MKLTQDTIQKAIALFENRERHDDSKRFWCMTNEAINELITNKDSLAAHISNAISCVDGDSSYLINKTVKILETLKEYDLDNIEDSLHEIVDGMVSIYTADRTAWLALHLDHVNFVDEVIEEYGDSGQGHVLDTFLGAAMYKQLDELATALIDALTL